MFTLSTNTTLTWILSAPQRIKRAKRQWAHYGLLWPNLREEDIYLSRLRRSLLDLGLTTYSQLGIDIITEQGQSDAPRSI